MTKGTPKLTYEQAKKLVGHQLERDNTTVKVIGVDCKPPGQKRRGVYLVLDQGLGQSSYLKVGESDES